MISGKMSGLGSNDDCYFYFYSSCTKGDDCPFRHCEAALGTETVCSLWREGRCIRDNCKFRHMESRINRGTIPCYWEDQPSGCLKPHCVFLHRKPRSNIHTNVGNEGLILPVSTTTPQMSPSNKMTEAKDTLKTIPVENYSSDIDDSICPASMPIEPIVFSFDNEESDSESTSSTPMKSASNDTRSGSLLAKKNLLNPSPDKNDDFGIKTLEQIKMEKIHKESDNFYKSAYDVPLIDPSQIKMKTDNFKTEMYPPKADFISISNNRSVAPLEAEFISTTSRSEDIAMCATTDSKVQSSENERNFKNRSLKRKSAPHYAEKALLPKKVVNLKKSQDMDTLDFKIKTLEEIRKEKMNKLGKEEVETSPLNVSPRDDDINESTALEKDESSNRGSVGKPFRKLRLKRPSSEILSKTILLQEADSSSDSHKKERNQMILQEVQNISEDQNKLDSNGKRKGSPSNDDDDDEKSPKQSRTESSSTRRMTAESEEGKPIKSSRPIIKRKRSTSSVFQSSAVSPPGKVSSTVAPEDAVPEKPRKVVLREKDTHSKAVDSDKRVSESERTIPRSSSVEDIDSFLLNETDVTLDYEPDATINESDDILLEIEQLLDS